MDLGWLGLSFGSDFWLSLGEIIWINLLLSGDNAVVIALACRGLPKGKRTLGVVLGAGAAIILRIIFTLLVNSLLGLPYLKVLGGFALLWIAIRLLTESQSHEDGVKTGTTLWAAIRTVAIADIVMSLDNVLAIAASAKGDPALIIMGLAISVPLIIGGATLLTAILRRFVILVWAGAALLGWIAGDLIASDPMAIRWLDEIVHRLGLPEMVHFKLKLVSWLPLIDTVGPSGPTREFLSVGIGAMIVVLIGAMFRPRQKT